MSAEKEGELVASPAVKRNWLGEGIFIATFSFVGYLLTYAYEIGFAESFGIPTALVEVNLNTVLFLTTVFGGTAVLFVQYIHYAVDDISNTRFSPVTKTIIVFVGIGLAASQVVRYVLNGHTKYWIWYWAIAGIVAVLVFALPLLLLLKARGKSYSECFADFWVSSRFDFTTRQPDTIFVLWMGLALLFLVMKPIATEAGRVRAQDMKDFEVLADESNTVVLGVHGDKMITATFDPCTKEIQGGVTVRRVAEPSVRLKRMLVGPLNLDTTNKTDEAKKELEEL